MTTLSPGQTQAFDQVMRWHAGDEQTFVLAGYAGTGKTTLARMIAEQIDPDGTLFCAFTGKAANVLRDKGCATAGTLHSYLYSLTDHNRQVIKQLEQDITEARAAGDGTRMDALLNLLEQKRAEFRRPKFALNEDSPLIRAPLVIVDEYSMLSEKLITDLQKLGKKILYLGDPFQLPPVEGICPLMPTVFLTEIHRQALESPIIRAATQVRENKPLAFGSEPGFTYQLRGKIAPETYVQADQIIVGRNITRQSWNRRFRQLRGYAETDLPREGEKMICLKNDPASELFNGMIGLACGDARNADQLRYTLDFDGRYSLPVFIGDIRGQPDKYDGYKESHKELQRFDYGYAITCHKAMGSEFDNMLVYHEPIGKGSEARRWLYTGISRAQNNCILVEP